MNHTNVSVKLSAGKIAPRYTAERKSLRVQEVVITEQGTESNLPLVDFQLEDKDGNTYWFCLTGRLVDSFASLIAGVNTRNHGKDRP